MSSTPETTYIVQRERWFDGGANLFWEDYYECHEGLNNAEFRLRRSVRLLQARKSPTYTGRYRLICRVMLIDEKESA